MTDGLAAGQHPASGYASTASAPRSSSMALAAASAPAAAPAPDAPPAPSAPDSPAAPPGSPCRQAPDSAPDPAPSGTAAAPEYWRTPDRTAHGRGRTDRATHPPAGRVTRCATPFSSAFSAATRTAQGSISVASTGRFSSRGRRHRQNPRPGPHVQNAPGPPPRHGLQRHQAPARRPVLAGSERQSRIQRQRDPVRRLRSRQMRPPHREPLPDQLLGERRVGPRQPAIRLGGGPLQRPATRPSSSPPPPGTTPVRPRSRRPASRPPPARCRCHGCGKTQPSDRRSPARPRTPPAHPR